MKEVANKPIAVKESTYKALKELAHSGQSFDGVIRKLIEKLKTATPSKCAP